MAAGGGPAAPSTVLPAGRGGVCRAVVQWLTASSVSSALPEADSARLLLVTGPRGAGKTFTLAWAASELAVLAEAADDERFAWVSARGLTPRVLAWQLAGQLGVTTADAVRLAGAVAGRLRGSGAGSEAADGPSEVEPTQEAGLWSRVTILISELDLAGHLRDGSAREAVISQLLAPLLAVPGVRLIVESAQTDLAEVASAAESSATVIDLGEARWTDRAEFAAWLDDLVPSGGAAAPQAYPNPTKAREILSLAAKRHAGLLAASDERPWKLAAVPFDVAFREGIADQIVLEPANLVLVQQPALSTAIDALGSAVAPGTRAAWRVAGQALTTATGVPERAAILHGAALAVGDHALAEAVAPYTRGTRPSDGAPVGEPVPWLTRWAGWRPLPPDTPRPMPWPGPVAALAVSDAGLEPPVAESPDGAGDQVTTVPIAARAAAGSQAAGGSHAAAHATAVPAGVAAQGATASAAAESQAASGSHAAATHAAAPTVAESQAAASTSVAEPTIAVPPAANLPANLPANLAAELAAAASSLAEAVLESASQPRSLSSAGAWLPDSEPTPPEVLVAIDDLARAYRLDPRSGRIVGRPASPVMVKARSAAVVDASPSLVLTDSSRRLAALGPTAPRGAVAAVRDVLPDTVVTAVAVARDALVFGAGDGRVHVWDVDTEELIADPEDQHSGAVTAVAGIWMPDTDVLFALSGGRDGTFRLWAVPASASLLPVEDRGVPVTAVTAAHTDVGPVAAVAWADGCVTVWDLDEARTGRPIPLGWTPKALALGGDGLLVAAGDDGLIAIELHLADFFED